LALRQQNLSEPSIRRVLAVEKYIRRRINIKFRDGIDLLIRRGYHPALCPAGTFELLGIAGYAHDLASAYSHLSNGARHNIWSCFEQVLDPENHFDMTEMLRFADALRDLDARYILSCPALFRWGPEM
jgi:hypothetical protein